MTASEVTFLTLALRIVSISFLENFFSAYSLIFCESVLRERDQFFLEKQREGPKETTNKCSGYDL